MDTQSLLCQWSTLCGRDEYFGHHVQKTGYIKYRYRTVYQLAISAMGHQTVVESHRRYTQDQAVLDYRYAVIDRSLPSMMPFSWLTTLTSSALDSLAVSFGHIRVVVMRHWLLVRLQIGSTLF